MNISSFVHKEWFTLCILISPSNLVAYQSCNKNGIAIFQKCLVFLVFFSMDNEILILFTKTENAPNVDVKFNHRFLLFISIELDNQSHTENPPVTFQRWFEIITFCAYSIRKNYWISTATKKNIVEWIVLYLRAYVIWYLFCYDGYKVYLLLDKPFNPTFFKKS